MRSSARLKELAEAPLGRLLFKYSWPALVAMTLNALYSVVDRFWIGRGAGEDAMAALTLSIPIMMVFGAFGVWIGAGHSAVQAERREGEQCALARDKRRRHPFHLWCGESRVCAEERMVD